MLPTKKTPAKTDPADFSMLLYGAPGVGKTTFASQAPNALFLATEPGQDAVECYRVDCPTYGQLASAVKEVIAESQAGRLAFKTIVIDTADAMYQACETAIMAEHNVQSINDGALGYGKGIALARSRFMAMIRALAALPQGLMILSHAVQEVSKDDEKGERTKRVPSLPEKIRAELAGFVGIIGYMEVATKRDASGAPVGIQYVTNFQPSVGYDAKDRTGKLPAQIPTSYAAFEAAFKGGTK